MIGGSGGASLAVSLPLTVSALYLLVVMTTSKEFKTSRFVSMLIL